jgi:hypothetical protein
MQHPIVRLFLSACKHTFEVKRVHLHDIPHHSIQVLAASMARKDVRKRLSEAHKLLRADGHLVVCWNDRWEKCNHQKGSQAWPETGL